MALVVKNAVKEAVKKCNVGSDFYGALDKLVAAKIATAERRAMDNGRKTVQARDL